MMPVETQICTCGNRFSVRVRNRCNCWRITLWRHPMRGPKGQGYSETLRQKDRADFSERDKEVPPCILCVCLGCAPESASFFILSAVQTDFIVIPGDTHILSDWTDYDACILLKKGNNTDVLPGRANHLYSRKEKTL